MVSHAYALGPNQAKLGELAKIPGVTLGVVAPARWKGAMGEHVFRCEAAGVRAFPYRVLFSGHIGAFCYPPSLFLALARFSPDIIHVEEEPWSLSAWQVVLATRLLGLRSKVILFTWENIGYPPAIPYRWFLRSVLRRADFAIAGNAEARALLIRHGVPAPRTAVLPQFGVDAQVYQRRPSEELRRVLGLGEFTVGYVGRLVPEKGLLTLLAALRRLPGDARLLLVGSGPLAGELARLSEAWGLGKRVIFQGAVPREEVPRYLSAMDVLVLPSVTTSRWKEQFGLALVEAMACEVPVVGSDSGEIPRVVADAGLIFREGDEADLSEKLSRLMTDAALRRDLARRGRELALACYASPVIARKTYEAYVRVLEGRG